MTRSLSIVLALLGLLTAAGCSEPSDSELDSGETQLDAGLELPDADADVPDTAMPDTGTAMPDTGMPDTGMPDTGTPAVLVHFTQPMSDVVVLAQPVMFQAVTSVPVSQVDILVDGVIVANLAPPYQYTLQVTPLTAGPHTVTPRAHLGGQAYDGPSITVTVDRTPVPQVTAASITGLNGAEYVSPARSPIYVDFGEPLGMGSTATIVVKRDATVLAGAIVLSGSRFVFTPTDRFLEGTNVSVTVTGNVRDALGNMSSVASTSRTLPVRSYWSDGPAIGQSWASASVPGNGDAFFVGIEGVPSGDRGTMEAFVQVDGASFPMPALDPGFSLTGFVDAGLGGNGVAFLFFEAIHETTGASAYVIARRARGASMWTTQTLVSHLAGATISQPALHVTGGGYALVRYVESTIVDEMSVSVTRTYAAAPDATTFTATSDYDGITLNDQVAFPGTAGRVCSLSSALVAPDNMQVDYSIVCQLGGLPTRTIPLGARSPAPIESMRMAANASGDAAVVIGGTTLYVFDGDAETVSSGSSTHGSNDFPFAMSFGPSGDTCFVFTRSFPFVIHHVHVVQANAAGVTTLDTNIQTFNGGFLGPQVTVATDAEGHCFINTKGTFVIHDATVDGAWSAPFQYATDGNSSRAFAGATNQAFLTTGNRSAFLKVFTAQPTLP